MSEEAIPQSNEQKLLEAMGFEEGELEMFFDMNNFTEDQLVKKYLEIAKNPPYNLLDWNEEIASSPDNYMLGISKPNGVQYTKHDIAKDTLDFYNSLQGGRKRNRKKKRSKKYRSAKRKHSRHRRTRYR